MGFNLLLRQTITVSVFLLFLLVVSTTTVAESKTRMTLEAATKIALEKLPGEILESELDNEDGVLAYDFVIQKSDGSVFEIEINAYNGTVISIEEE